MTTLAYEIRGKELLGRSIAAADGAIGNLDDIYFDDGNWSIRYLIVETGGWLSGRKVLISPVALATHESTVSGLPLNLSKEQIRNSPDIAADKPVSKRHLEELAA